MLELISANSDNQVLTVLRSGKETLVVWTYGKKAVDGTVESTETAEEPNKLLTVSMPLGLFKRAITQRGLSVEKFVKDLNIDLLAVNFLMVRCTSSLRVRQNFLKECCRCCRLWKFRCGYLLWLCLLSRTQTR